MLQILLHILFGIQFEILLMYEWDMKKIEYKRFKYSWYPIGDSVDSSVSKSVIISVENSVYFSTHGTFRSSVWDSATDYVWNSVWESIETNMKDKQ